MSLPERAQALLDAWFGPPGDPGREQHRDIWFKSTAEFDAVLRDAFLADYEAGAAGELREWEVLPEGALALVLLLDQIPRNIFRGTRRAYATDAAARAAADRAIERGFDRLVPLVWRRFLYMPLHHSEDLADQRRSLALLEALPRDPDRPTASHYFNRYNDIIERFGRFPHRNAILDRESTPAEIAFLAERDKSTRANEIIAELVEGAVAIFDEGGHFIKELVAGSRLAAPWGITFAPPGFRRFSNDVLVGNFSFKHSEINAFIPSNGKLHGTIPIDTGDNQPGGLWAIEFGVGGKNGSPDVLYFADGINGEADGLFGAITAH